MLTWKINLLKTATDYSQAGVYEKWLLFSYSNNKYLLQRGKAGEATPPVGLKALVNNVVERLKTN